MRRRILGLALLLLIIPFLPAQEIAEDWENSSFSETALWITHSSRGTGYDLFVHKIYAMESVQLFLEYRYETNALPLLAEAEDGSLEPLFSSSPELHKLMGEVFYFYLPPVLYLEPPEGPLISISLEQMGVDLTVRFFPGKEPGPVYQDAPFTIRADLAGPPIILPPDEVEAKPGPLFSLALSLGAALFNAGPEAFPDKNFKLLPRLEPGGELSFLYAPPGSLAAAVLVERDFLLMNRLILRGRLNAGPFSLEAGPFLGFINPAPEFIAPGISAAIGAALPPGNALSGRIRVDTSLVRPLKAGEYFQSLLELSLAYALEPFSFALTLSSREFARLAAGGFQFDYRWLRADLAASYAWPQKNLGISLNLGLQELRMNYLIYLPAARTGEYRYFNVYLGPGGTLRFPGENLELSLRLELPVYPLAYIAAFRDSYFFNANLAVRWSF
jgi:hypothetical protein